MKKEFVICVSNDNVGVNALKTIEEIVGIEVGSKLGVVFGLVVVITSDFFIFFFLWYSTKEEPNALANKTERTTLIFKFCFLFLAMYTILTC